MQLIGTAPSFGARKRGHNVSPETRQRAKTISLMKKLLTDAVHAPSLRSTDDNTYCFSYTRRGNGICRRPMEVIVDDAKKTLSFIFKQQSYRGTMRTGAAHPPRTRTNLTSDLDGNRLSAEIIPVKARKLTPIPVGAEENPALLAGLAVQRSDQLQSRIDAARDSGAIKYVDLTGHRRLKHLVMTLHERILSYRAAQ